MFENERVLLRKPSTDDIGVYHNWRNDTEVMKTTLPLLDVYSYEETEAFFTNVIMNTTTSKSYMIIEKEKNIPIGITSLVDIDSKNRNAEFIIDIGERAFWSKGYGAEVMEMLLFYSFLEINLHRLSLRVFSFNENAIKLYEKMGFTGEGISKECIYRNGEWHDIINMAILQKDYIQNNKRTAL